LTERWQTAAGSIEAYRSRWNITGERPIGPEPRDPEQHAHWEKTVAIIGTSGFFSPGQSPEAGSEREVLASTWEAVQIANQPPEHERAAAPAPEKYSTRSHDYENDYDRGYDRDDGFGL